MTPEALARLHALCFTETPRPWSAKEFAALTTLPGALLITQKHGFAFGRTAGREAELLTLAVHPGARRTGVGMALIRAFEQRALVGGATEAVLEVAESNGPARAIYSLLSYRKVGRRPGYYRRADALPIDGLILRKTLVPTGRGIDGEII